MKANIGVMSALLAVAVVTNAHAQFPGGGDRQAQGPDPSVIDQRFATADIDHNGKLTKEEARAGMPRVYAEFDQIDVAKKGYVTLEQAKAYLSSKQ